ncbi:MAG TPA: hypothetical protein EYN86_02315 [Planctomycetes bacterium]|nr:hypothetical protein [Planctomycetota bacterium]
MRTLTILLSFTISFLLAACGSSDSSGSSGPGGTPGPVATNLWRLVGDTGYAFINPEAFTSNLDLSGDGIDDVLLGLPYAEILGIPYVGRIMAVSGATGDVLWELNGIEAWQNFGGNFFVTEDINGDGISEIIAASPWLDDGLLTASGRMACFSGKDGALLWENKGTMDNEKMGRYLDRAVDFNGDGMSDFLSRSPRSSVTNFNEGRVGAVSGSDGSILWSAAGDNGADYLGDEYVITDDMNGDGVPDVAVSAPSSDAAFPDGGYILLLSGMDGSQIWRKDGANDKNALGNDLTLVGDVNGDGFGDLLTSSDFSSNNNSTSNGTIAVHSGLTGDQIWRVDGEQNNHRIGHNTLLVGDIDDDNINDIYSISPEADAVGQFGLSEQAGDITLYSGADGIEIWSEEGDIWEEYLGMAFTTISDVNGDGYEDCVTANGNYPSIANPFGRILVLSGFDGTIIHTFSGAEAGQYLGQYFQLIDLDGDGSMELIAWAQGANTLGNTANGSVSAFSLATGVELWRRDGNDLEALTVNAICPDVNGDGYQDIIAGGRESSNGLIRNGRTKMISGATGDDLWHTAGTYAWSENGSGKYLVAPDVDGDGIADVLESYTFGNDADGLISTGRMTLLSGANGNLMWEIVGLEAFGYLGESVSEFQDLDSDGVPDLLEWSGYASIDGLDLAGRLQVISSATGARAVAE